MFTLILANPSRSQVGLEQVFFQTQEENNFLSVLYKQGMKLYRIICGLEWLKF